MKRLDTRWDTILDKAILIEDILSSKDNPEHKIRSPFWIEREGLLGGLIDKIIWFWYVKLKKSYLLCLSFIFGILSILVLLGEFSIFTKITELSIFGMVIHYT